MHNLYARSLTRNSKHLMIIHWMTVAFTNDKIQIGGSWNQNKVRLWLTFLNSLSFTSEAAKTFLFANLFILNVSDYAFRSDLAARDARILISTLLSPCPLRPFACLPWKAAVISSRQLSKEPLSHTSSESSGWPSLRSAIAPPATLDATFPSPFRFSPGYTVWRSSFGPLCL